MCTSLDDAKGILADECGICLRCHDHKPCGCEPVNEVKPGNYHFDFEDEKRRSEGE